tara:strand:- start:10728 stop:10976 length:249 start_codon:yes stop_codon:yes gene_type:complete
MKYDMTYDIVIQTVSEIVNNDLIHKKGLELTYKLNAKNHKKLSEHFFHKINDVVNEEYEYTEEFQVDMGNVIINFIINEQVL